jgi:hypothetical protein
VYEVEHEKQQAASTDWGVRKISQLAGDRRLAYGVDVVPSDLLFAISNRPNTPHHQAKEAA